jgi:hypothetical protein
MLVPAPAQDTPRAPGVADSLKPFVDNHSLAGAVVLVADRNQVLALEAIGFADVSAGQKMLTDALF